MTSLTLQRGDPIFDATIAAQATASDPRISIWASANAGAGKTKVLIDRIARLLLAGAQPGRVLAVTYTKAAAAEMQTRLYDKLGSWTIASDADLRAALQELDSDLDLSAPRTLSRARSLFARALETPGGLKIQTIHAFCQTILQRFPLEAGVPPSFEVLDDAAKQDLIDIAYDAAADDHSAVFLALAAKTSQGGDRDALMAAIGHSKGLAALASSGTDLEARLSAALGTAADVTPESVVAEALQRLDVAALARARPILAAGEQNDQKIAKAIGILTESPDKIAIWAALTSLVLTDKGDVRKKQIFTAATKKDPAVIAALGPHEIWPSAFCDTLLDAEDRRRNAILMHNSLALSRAALAFSGTWVAAKRARGCLDYDDLIAATANLLRAGAGAAQWVLYKLDAGIEHILIDEAQDTAPNQWDLLAPLFEVLEQETRDTPRTRFVVGDDKQSIYSFQGARPERFELERAKFEHAGEILKDGRAALTFDLSFRTGQTILNAVDAVWTVCQTQSPPNLRDGVGEDAPLERKYAFASRHSAFRSQQIGAVELWPLTEKNEVPPDREAWEHSLNYEREDSARNQLADRIATALKSRIDSGLSVWDKGGPRTLEPRDIMILVKSRGPLFHQIIRRLKFHKVPVAGADRIKLVEDAGVQDLIALARFALLPEDDFNMACVLKGAFCGLLDEDTHLFPLAYDRKEQSLWDRLQASPVEAHKSATAFLKRVEAGGAHLPAYEFFAGLLELPLCGAPTEANERNFSRTGWQALIERLGLEVRDPVEALLIRALDHGRRSSPSLHAFLSQLETDATDVKREMDQVSSGVRVMTIHGAKGLEAPVVILPETTSKPKTGDNGVAFDEQARAFLWSPIVGEDTLSYKALREKAANLHRGEDARLLYVAMTRARDLLILCGHEHGNSGKGDTASKKKPDEERSWTWYETIEKALPVLGAAELVNADGFCFQKWGSYPPAPLQTIQTSHQVPEALPDWISRPPVQHGPSVRRIAPSALTPQDSEPPALSPLVPDARRRFLRGRLIHELLQRLPEVAKADWQRAAERRLAREADLDDTAKAAMIAETLAVLNHPEFKAIFGPGSRAEAAIAGRGIGLPADMVVNGSVDRLVVTDTQVLVLDFKTNRPPPQRVEDVAQVYLNQMAAYRALLQATWPDKATTCALLWTDGPFLMELPHSSLDQALHLIAALPS